MKGLLRDTWWLWPVFLVAAIVLGLVVHKIFFIFLLVFVFVFAYFAFVRYDEEGNRVEDQPK